MTTPQSDIAIATHDLTKRFVRVQDRATRLKDAVVRRLTFRPVIINDFAAVNNISLEIRRGEAVGFIGPNGSGKSTLLALLARILRPTSGSVTVNGRVSVLLEVGAGFHGDLTGVENIYLNGAIIGLKRRELSQAVDEILDFAELQEVRNMPVRTYSVGMKLRLGFAVSTHLNPDIMLVDEALSVGDERYQVKCYEWMRAFRDGHHALGLVTHELHQIRRICERVVWMDRGIVRMDGPTEAVLQAYEQWAQEGNAER
jgi:ABC-2 type transport system ATP-binding protein/lipopolysaccharide transport system ATP-binding protein